MRFWLGKAEAEIEEPDARRPAVAIRLELDSGQVIRVVNAADGAPADGIELESEPLGDLDALANRLRQSRLASRSRCRRP